MELTQLVSLALLTIAVSTCIALVVCNILVLTEECIPSKHSRYELSDGTAYSKQWYLVIRDTLYVLNEDGAYTPIKYDIELRS